MSPRSVLVCASLAILALGASACSSDPQQKKREYVERGDRYMQDKNVEAAIIEYRNAIQIDSRFGEGYRKLATAYLTRATAAKRCALR